MFIQISLLFFIWASFFLRHGLVYIFLAVVTVVEMVLITQVGFKVSIYLRTTLNF